MLRPAISDPVLIKPHEIDFLRGWNSDREPNHPTDSSADQLYGIFISLSDANANDSKMPKSEREKRQKKLEFQLKRRNSVLLANFKEEYFVPGGMKRSWSCVELGKICCRETTTTKRVSFSVTVPPPAYPDFEKSSLDLCPPKIAARPILVRRNTTYTGRDCLVHMDFDSFTAWRRGSKMSDDVERIRKDVKDKKKEANGSTKRKDSSSLKKEEAENGDWWIVRVIKLGFDSCFQRRRVTPSPPPSTDTSNTVAAAVSAY